MGAIGKYLDGLDDDARDRVITAQDWPRDGGAYSFVYKGQRCLVGHAEDWYHDEIGHSQPRTKRYPGCAIYGGFPRIVKRIGLERAVRLVKARAARAHSIPLPSRSDTVATPSNPEPKHV